MLMCPFAAIITEYSPGFVIILVVNLASKFVFEIGAGTILLYGSLKVSPPYVMFGYFDLVSNPIDWQSPIMV